MASSLFASLIGNLNVLKEEVDEQVITLPTLHSNSVRYSVENQVFEEYINQATLFLQSSEATPLFSHGPNYWREI